MTLVRAVDAVRQPHHAVEVALVAGPEVAPDPLPRPDRAGWVTLDLAFVAVGAARAILAGFGDAVEVVRPVAVREAMVALAREILSRYGHDG